MDNFIGLVLTHRGTEDVAAREVEELIKVKAEARQRAVLFPVKKPENLFALSYMSQSAARVALLLCEPIRISRDIDEVMAKLEPRIKDIDFARWIRKDAKFKVECLREGEHDFTSQELSLRLGGLIAEKIMKEKGYEQDIDLKNPDVIVFVLVVDEDLYLGVDFVGFDMSKRDYKIMSHMPSIKGSIGYALLRLCGYTKKAMLLDPSSFSGVVPIEAAIFATNRPTNYYRKTELIFQRLGVFEGFDFEKFFKAFDGKIVDKADADIFCINDQLRYISAAKANAKIAGVHKSISFSRFDAEWFDTKFGKGSVDLIAANAHRISKLNEREMEKYYEELFYQADYVLKKNGKIGLLCNSVEIIKDKAKKHDFKLLLERIIWQGKEELRVVVFGR